MHPAVRAKAPRAVESPAWAVPGLDADDPQPDARLPSASAERVSMSALARHDLSTAELAARLRKQGLEEREILGEVDRLKRVGLLDDRKLTEHEIARLREQRGLGDSAIRSRLQRRGVDRVVIDAAFDALSDAHGEGERLRALAEQRAVHLAGLPHDTAVRRLSAYLQRRGYSGEQVRDAVAAALSHADR